MFVNLFISPFCRIFSRGNVADPKKKIKLRKKFLDAYRVSLVTKPPLIRNRHRNSTKWEKNTKKRSRSQLKAADRHMYTKLSETIGTRTAGDQLFKLVIISTNNFKLPITYCLSFSARC